MSLVVLIAVECSGVEWWAGTLSSAFLLLSFRDELFINLFPITLFPSYCNGMSLSGSSLFFALGYFFFIPCPVSLEGKGKVTIFHRLPFCLSFLLLNCFVLLDGAGAAFLSFTFELSLLVSSCML